MFVFAAVGFETLYSARARHLNKCRSSTGDNQKKAGGVRLHTYQRS